MRPLIVTMGSAELSVSGVSTASEFSSAEREAGRLLFAQPWDFATAASSLESLPKMRGIEIAFAGRSNVGKSSLINALTGRNALARTSHTPGRTQELIFFSADPNLTLVDMPGYGYAAAPKDIVKAWTKLIHDYLVRPCQSRPGLCADRRASRSQGRRHGAARCAGQGRREPSGRADQGRSGEAEQNWPNGSKRSKPR